MFLSGSNSENSNWLNHPLQIISTSFRKYKKKSTDTKARSFIFKPIHDPIVFTYPNRFKCIHEWYETSRVSVF